MERKYIFKVLIDTKGNKSLTCFTYRNEYSFLKYILFAFPNISELTWYKSEVSNAQKKGARTYTGLNTFFCYVTDDKCELYQDYNESIIQTIPTDVVLDFIDRCIEFHELYNSGGIRGVIPESKEKEWIIAPRKYVDKAYLDSIDEEQEGKSN